ncbi:hypothetical protein Tco_0664066 [Tanacetum coccineum]
MRNHRIAKVELAPCRVGLPCESDGFVLGCRGRDGNDADNQDDDGQEYDVQDDQTQDDDNEQTDSDNDGDDFVHPKFSTHDDEAKQNEEVNEEDSFDPRVQTHSHVESTDDEDSDEEIQDANVEGDKINEEETNEEAEVVALYRDVNVNLEGRDTEMTDAPSTIVQTTQVIEDTHVIITPVNPEGQQQSSSVSSSFVSNMLNPSPDTGIDSLFKLNTESTSLVDVLVTAIAEPSLLSITTLPPPPTPLITHLYQAPVRTPATVTSSFLQDLPNFGPLFGFDHRPKTLETDFSEFKQTNQFSKAVSSIPNIVDKLRDEDQAENEDFLNSLDDNIKKIIKDQVKQQVKAQVSKILPKIEKSVNEQLEAEVMTCSSTEYKTSHDVAANLSELELKKILIDKMESNKSIHRSDEQKNLYKALVDAYKSTSAPKEKTSKTTGKSTEGSKSHHKSADESAQAEEPMHTTKDLEEPTHQEFKTRVTEDQPNEETPQFPDWFQRPTKLPSPDRDWNKTLPDAHGPVDTLTPELLTGLIFELMKGSCKSLVKLEYLFEEVYKATTDQLDWNNLEEYLSGGVSSRKYATSMTKTKVADYGHIKWIEDLVPNRMWSQVLSKRKIIAVTKLEIVNWHNYKHLDWITVRWDDDKLYKFKEGDFNRLRIQDIENMMLLLVQ